MFNVFATPLPRPVWIDDTEKTPDYYRSDEDWFRRIWDPVLAEAFAHARPVTWVRALGMVRRTYVHYLVYRFIVEYKGVFSDRVNVMGVRRKSNVTTSSVRSIHT